MYAVKKEGESAGQLYVEVGSPSCIIISCLLFTIFVHQSFGYSIA